MSQTWAISCFVWHRRLKKINSISRMEVCCAICLNDTCAVRTSRGGVRSPKHGDVYLLGCRHGFHRKCLKRWYLESVEPNPSCPCCRTPIRIKNISSLFNEFLCRLKFTPISEKGFQIFSEFIRGLCVLSKYIYYDNPGISLYIYHVKVNLTHHRGCSFDVPFKR